MSKNILIFITDQQRWDSLACNGNSFTSTPVLDALARDGACFENATTPFPVCTPARASMWTGTLPHEHGVTYNRYGIPDVLTSESRVDGTVFEPLRAAGYEAAYFGKWHLGEDSSERFDHWAGFNSRGGHWKDGKQSFQDGQWNPNVQSDALDAWLSQRDGTRPFVAVQSFYPPHQPFTAPAQFYDLYRGKGVPYAGYYASVSALDHCIGQSLAHLETLGLTEDTIVIFLSDHGETFDLSPEKPHKFSCLDTSIRVPLIIRGPGVEAGTRPTRRVSLEDLSPTMLDIAGLPKPDFMGGESFLSDKTSSRTGAYIQNETCVSRTSERAWRTDRWKLIVSATENHCLYDLEADPEEVLNIYGAPKPDIHDQYAHYDDMNPVIASLAADMLAHARNIGDVVGADLVDKVLRRTARA